MKKTVSCLLALIFSLSCFALTVKAASGIIITPGSTMRNAPTISFGMPYSGVIVSNQSSYYYKFLMPSSGRITFTFYSETLQYVDFDFCSSSGNRIGEKHDLQRSGSTGTMSESGFIDLVAGTYYFRLIRNDIMNSNGEFSFSLGYADADEAFQESETENNNYMGAAFPVSLNKWIFGQIADNDSRDYYCFSVPSAQTIRLQFTGDFWLVNIYVRDSNSNILFRKTNIERNNALGKIAYDTSISFSKAGTYYLQIDEVSDFGSVTGNYSFLLGNSSLQEQIITFKGNGGSIYPTNRYVQTGNPVTLPFAARAGYSFIGWATQANATKPNYLPGNKLAVQSSLTLYAVWELFSNETYTVTFNGNGGMVSISSKAVTAGTAITLPSATRNGYILLGWATNASASSPSYFANSSYTVNGNITLYAVWKANPIPTTEVAVHFDGNGGTVSTNFYSVPAGSTITLPSAKRSGYTFLGWSEDNRATSAQYAEGAAYTVTTEVTLYAVWHAMTVWQRLGSFFTSILSFFMQLIGAIGKVFG